MTFKVRTLQQQTGALYPGQPTVVTTRPDAFVPETVSAAVPLTLNSRGDSIRVFPNDTIVIRQDQVIFTSLA